MKLTILAFGIAQDIIGTKALNLETQNSTVGALRSQLLETYPGLAGLASLMIAVNSEYATDQTAIKDADEIALIPPTSGG